MSWPWERSKNTSVRQSVVLADTREGQVRVGVHVPSMRGETGHSLYVLQQRKVVGCCPGGRTLSVRRWCAVAPVDMLTVEVTNVQTGNVGMAVGVSHDGRALWTLMILYPAMSTHDHQVSDFSGDCSTNDHSNRSWTNVARAWFLLRTDPANAKLGIISLSKTWQYWTCPRTVLKSGRVGWIEKSDKDSRG